MTTYIYQRKGWPHFRWRDEVLAKPLAEARHHQGRLLGRMDELNPNVRREASLESLTAEAVKSSEIEGEKLDEAQVRSSVARRLKIDLGPAIRVERQVQGMVDMILDATTHYDRALTKERLFAWHKSLFGAERAGIDGIVVGQWRNGPMRVLSGPIGHEKLHHEAPPAHRVSAEMREFLRWFNREDQELDPVLKAGVAHLWFVTIHPFDDGNGRIARAIADMVLARSEQSAQRFYSMSAQIRRERKQYYDYLEETQKGDLDITAHLRWFIGCFDRALANAGLLFGDALRKARFWEQHTATPFNDRQRMMLVRMLDGFEGKLTSSKWASLTKCSQDTAARDIDALTKLGILAKDAAGGRSTSYSLVEDQ
jgi:Fic family protein